MNKNENAIQNERDILNEQQTEELDFDELEMKLQGQLEEELGEMQFLADEKAKIGSPDNLGNVIMEVVWEQFLNQVAVTAGEDFIKENRGLHLDLRNEAHIQTTENFADGKIATHNTEIDYQKRYDDWQSNFQKDPNIEHKTTHLKDIDNMWDTLSNALDSLNELTSEIETVKKDIALQKQDIAKALAFVDLVSQYEHLQDVDIVWDKVESNEKKLEALAEQSERISTAIAETQSDVRALEAHKQKIESIVHLRDIDDTWASAEKHTIQIEELQTQDNEIKKLIQQNRDFSDQALKAEKEANDSAIQQLNKKIQYAYWIAGGSMALTIVELLLLLLR